MSQRSGVKIRWLRAIAIVRVVCVPTCDGRSARHPRRVTRSRRSASIYRGGELFQRVGTFSIVLRMRRE